jgi:hypothetical protein
LNRPGADAAGASAGLESEASSAPGEVQDLPETRPKERPKVAEPKPPKNISSNWTKYEIPSEDEGEGEETMTGLSFSYALENAGKRLRQFHVLCGLFKGGWVRSQYRLLFL